MQSGLPSLLELQHAFADALGSADDGSVSSYVNADGLAPRDRIDIYRNTANAVLVAALRLSYPAVQALVGAEFFEGAARLFIEASPPRGAWLDAYGEDFPEFLARLPEAAALGYLPDVARLEWAVNTVLHAPDATPVDLQRLAQADIAVDGEICFVPHPAVRLLHAAYPVDAIWRSVLMRDDRALERIDPAAGPAWLLVCRTPDGISVDRLDAWHGRFTAALLDGEPLHAALGAAPPADAHAWLATLLSSGCFTGFGRPHAPDLNDPEPSS